MLTFQKQLYEIVLTTLLIKKAFDYLAAPIIIVAAFDTPISCSPV